MDKLVNQFRINMDSLSKVKPTGIPDFVPGSLIGETARFFGMSVAPVVPQKPVAIRASPVPSVSLIGPKNAGTPTRLIVSHPPVLVRRTLKLPNNQGNLNYYLNSGTKNHKSKVNTRRKH
jgi:hypothetical protein